MPRHPWSSLMGGLLFGLCFMGCARGEGGTPPSQAPGRVVVFGIDGADWRVIDPLIASGRMPNMARVVREGSHGVLHSMQPSASPSLWTTIATGVRPERHGIHGFVVGDEGEEAAAKGAASPAIRPVTSAMRKAPAFWNILGRYGRKSGVVGWLVTWPAEPVEGYVVSSYLPYVYNWSTGRPLKGTIVEGIPHQTFPEGLIDELEPLKVRPADLDPALVSRFYDPASISPLSALDQECVVGFDWSLACDETYGRIGRHLFARYPVDLFAVYFGGIDVSSHRFWRFAHPDEFPGTGEAEQKALGGVIDAYYVYLDGLLGAYLADLTPRDTLVVLSDHGFKPVHLPDQPATTGHHREEGILSIAGRGALAGGTIENASLLDVLPLLLRLLDVPIARNLEGHVPEGALDPGFLAAHPAKQVDDYGSVAAPAAADTSDLDANVLERLRSLGYIN